jgi:hypothetical protein
MDAYGATSVTLADWRWYGFDRDLFIGWLNQAAPGINNFDLFVNGNSADPSDREVIVSCPRGSGMSSVSEKSRNYGGPIQSAEPEASKGAPAFTLSIGAYLELIYEQLLAKGDQLHANTVKSILDQWNAGKITDAEALDELNHISFNP